MRMTLCSCVNVEILTALRKHIRPLNTENYRIYTFSFFAKLPKACLNSISTIFKISVCIIKLRDVMVGYKSPSALSGLSKLLFIVRPFYPFRESLSEDRSV